MRQFPPPWLRGSAIGLLLVTSLACGDPVYDVKFSCRPTGGTECPEGLTCPLVPLGSGGCEDLPGFFGHAPTAVDAGRPVGCSVGLSYGNPYYGNGQVVCDCRRRTPEEPASWGCPL